MKNTTKIIAAISPILLLIGAGTASAQQDATGTLVVEATVSNVCSVATTPVTFGEVGLTDVSTNGSITVTCTIFSPFEVALDGGNAGDINGRQMDNGLGNTIDYQLYTEANNTTVWGDGTSGSTVDGTGPSETLTVYGATLSGPEAAGTYTDSVTVTVTY
ncbi:spore coat U domain-containing protein [Hellea sp.]|nr:spore coat U domain-containing protein [Hellea sp.]